MTKLPPFLSEADIKFIRKSQIFMGVDIEDLSHLIAECQLLDIHAGTTLIQIKTSNEYFYVVLSGALNVYLDSDIAKHFITLQPGDCAGELSIIDGEVTSAKVIAAEDSRLLKIDQETLWRLVRASHSFARNLLHVLSKRMRHNNFAIVDGLRHEQELEHIANVDGLTGLFNRRWMNNFFKRQINRALKDNRPMALIMADLDNFKHVNDAYGHLAGDEALCTVASILTQHIRPSDLVARFGGEEFALILPDTSTEEAMQIAERVRAAIESTHIQVDPETSQEVRITISLGVTSLLLGDEIDSMLARADQALYRAKEKGRNSIEML